MVQRRATSLLRRRARAEAARMDAVSLQLTARTLDGARESIAAAQSATPNQAAPATPAVSVAAPEVILDLSEAAQQLMTLPDAPSS